MDAYPDILAVGRLLGDPARVAMLVALLDGRPRPASELAWLAQVSRQAASAHLAKLVEGGLLVVMPSGRHRYYRLKNRQVARVIEALAGIAPPARAQSLRTSQELDALRFARICYDHLAGYFGVLLTEALLEREWLIEGGKNYELTEAGAQGFARLGIPLPEVRGARRMFAYPCADWSEGRAHLAGALGAALFKRLSDLGWVERAYAKRAVRLTDVGRLGIRESLGLTDIEPAIQDRGCRR